jgi:hypothetical protein
VERDVEVEHGDGLVDGVADGAGHGCPFSCSVSGGSYDPVWPLF